MTDNMAQFSLDAALRSPRSIHGRGGEGVRADHAALPAALRCPRALPLS